MKKKVIILLSVFMLVALLMSFFSQVEATEVISAMSGLNNPSADEEVKTKLGPIINTVIGFIQIVGTGLSVIMVTVLGIKYMLASPGDKADVKKQIAPLVIGAVVLFASVNIVQIIANFAATLPTAGGTTTT